MPRTCHSGRRASKGTVIFYFLSFHQLLSCYMRSMYSSYHSTSSCHAICVQCTVLIIPPAPVVLYVFNVQFLSFHQLLSCYMRSIYSSYHSTSSCRAICVQYTVLIIPPAPVVLYAFNVQFLSFHQLLSCYMRSMYISLLHHFVHAVQQMQDLMVKLLKLRLVCCWSIF